MARNESVNSENLSDVDALKIIAKENKEYTLEEVNDRFWELTERKLSKTQLNTLWYTVVGITESEDDSKEDSIAEILEKAEKSEFLQASAELVETLTKKERKSKMVKKVKANSESLSGVIRKILSNNFDLPIAKIKEKCQQIVGKQPSNPLIFQIKAKMKQGKELKSKTKKVSSVSKKLKTVASSDNYILDVTEKVKKAKLLIEEFHGKDNLINFLQAL
jgi:hypothetical protein